MPSRSVDFPLVGVVDRRQVDLLCLDVVPDVELGPVREREDPDVLAGQMAPVVERPELGALVARLPLAELVAHAEDALLGAGPLLVAPPAAEDGVVLAGGDRVQQRDGLEWVAGAVRSLPEPAVVDVVLHRGDLERGAVEVDGLSRNCSTSGKLCPVSTCSSSNGIGAGQNAFAARCSMTTESLPPEKSMIGEENVAATSRMMWIDSDSSAWSSVSGRS